MKELLKEPMYVIGLICGIAYIAIVSREIYMLQQWHWIYIAPYICMIFFQMMISDEDDTDNTFTFMLGANIPTFIATLLLFAIVDKRNANKKKHYGKYFK